MSENELWKNKADEYRRSNEEEIEVKEEDEVLSLSSEIGRSRLKLVKGTVSHVIEELPAIRFLLYREFLDDLTVSRMI